jgi:two-component sensor histidine kinase
MSAQVRPRSRIAFSSIPALSARLRSATTTIIAIGVVGVAIIVAAWINAAAQATADRMSHAIEVRERAERFLGHVRDAETGQRGYLLTGRVDYLAPYTAGRAAALPELDGIAKLVAADRDQSARVARAREDAIAKLEELDTTVALSRGGRREAALARVLENAGATAMDSLRAGVRQLQLAENRRIDELGQSETQRRLLASTGSVIALAALAFAAWQQLRTRQRRTIDLRLSNAELERIVGERTQQLENERLRIEALLRDVNHRVGNNLAMVSALLNVQSRQSKEPAVRTALGQAQSRIQAIAAGQRRLRLDIETDEIDARPYMEDLLAEIGKAVDGRPIAMELEMDDIRLPGRDAVSFVVIVNELVTNAIKHAFPDGMSGRIVIRLREEDGEGEPRTMLEVADDGVGMPEDSASKGLGQTVIASLLRSMRATMSAQPVHPGAKRPGLAVTLTFPKQD